MKIAAFFGKLWLKIQSATKKVWALAKLHKVISIAIAATVVAGTTCAIVLPIALHNHEYSDAWTSDAESHWHEASCRHEEERSDVAPHTYANDCDRDCDVCGKTRSITHTYDNACDDTCNVCAAVREEIYHVFFNICDTDCNICGKVREVGAHIYDNTCDTVCNACGAEREITHTYDNACDTVCNICEYTRKTEHNYVYGSSDGIQHWYECTGCGARVNSKDHRYDNNCDTTCNDCGHERTITHTYATEMYKNAEKHWYECEICGVKKSEGAHNYSSDCDTSCNDCNAIRKVTGHVFDDNCDTVCNVENCGYVRVIEHDYEMQFNEDKHWYECSVCNVTKDEAIHLYSHSCDTTCNKCGAERIVEDHPYKDTYTANGSYHWFECRVCKDRIGEAAHVYTSDCDTTCNTCEYVRTVNPHVYTNACDTVCNVENCGYEREVAPHPYASTYTTDATNHWLVCEICENIGYIEAHEYDNDCDTTCNTCAYERTVPEHPYNAVYSKDSTNHWRVCDECEKIDYVAEHDYDNACDTACNVCAYTREVGPHIYDNDCDANCNICDAARQVPDHIYDNDCDTTCNECADVREVNPHVYTNTCDTTCNVCGKVRTIEHKYVLTVDADNHWEECSVCHDKINEEEHGYDNACDTTCDACDYVREITHDYQLTNDSDKHWKECSVCHDVKDEADHLYTNSCDTECNGCTYEREITHTFESCDDTVCDVCGDVREALEHTYSGGCDPDCDVCFSIRDSLPHEYATEYTTDGTSHWYQCSGCNSRKDEAEHDDGKDSDTWYHWSKCSVCGYEQDDIELHDYSEFGYDDEQHWYKCVCGAFKDKAEHHWSFVNTDANEHYYECIDCHNKKDVVAHNYPDSYEINNDTHSRVCEDCAYIDIGAHNYPDDYTANNEQHWKDCTVCAYHNVADHEGTWTYDNTDHYYECEVCAKKYDVESHNFQRKIESEEYRRSDATETTKASYFYICRYCDKVGENYWEKDKNEAIVEIYVLDKTYNGVALTVRYDKTSDDENPEMWYKLKGAEEFTPYHEGDIVDAGEYVIKITTKETKNYNAGEEIVEVTIRKATVILNWETPDSIFDGTDKAASVTIVSGVVDGEDVRVECELVSGNITEQDQTIVYNATLEGSDKDNYVIKSDMESVTYYIDPCVHVERTEIGFCALCGVYPDTFVQTGVGADGNPDGYYMYTKYSGDYVTFENIDPSTTTVYCRFQQQENSALRGNELEYCLFRYEIPGYEYYFDDYRAYIGDADGNITAEITDDLTILYGAYITLEDQFIYFVITLDGSMTQFAFGVEHYTHLN